LPFASRDQDDARRLLQYEIRRAGTPRTARPLLSGMPSGTPVDARPGEETCAACGPAGTRDCSLGPIRIGLRRARATPPKRVGDLLHESRAPPVALPVRASRSKTPRAARERRGPASSPSREREQFHANRGAFRRQDPATYARIAPVRPLRVASLFWSADPSGERAAGTGGPMLRSTRVSLSPWTGGGGGPGWSARHWDDVRPSARRPKRP